MKEVLINFETANLAKEKGFTLDRYIDSACYLLNKELFPSVFSLQNYDCGVGRELTKFIYAPTQSLLQKWLREKYDTHVQIVLTEIQGEDIYPYYFYLMGITNKILISNLSKQFQTYEEALEAGLQEALKLIP